MSKAVTIIIISDIGIHPPYLFKNILVICYMIHIFIKKIRNMVLFHILYYIDIKTDDNNSCSRCKAPENKS
jgi:hypothetical protein